MMYVVIENGFVLYCVSVGNCRVELTLGKVLVFDQYFQTQHVSAA
jgi:hypothetical protein